MPHNNVVITYVSIIHCAGFNLFIFVNPYKWLTSVSAYVNGCKGGAWNANVNM